ncbi:MAG TPA: hypothetical protein VJ883_08705 [Woeseiaceae bacterium]|nr:hypothetical protein [Woeseiaceae bacterium]
MSKELPRTARGRRNRFFEAEGVDELLSMVMELTAEVATLRERLYVTERVLEHNGLAVGEGIERYEITDEDDAWLAAERERLLSTVLRTIESGSRDAREAAPAGEDSGDEEDPGKDSRSVRAA